MIGSEVYHSLGQSIFTGARAAICAFTERFGWTNLAFHFDEKGFAFGIEIQVKFSSLSKYFASVWFRDHYFRWVLQVNCILCLVIWLQRSPRAIDSQIGTLWVLNLQH